MESQATLQGDYQIKFQSNFFSIESGPLTVYPLSFRASSREREIDEGMTDRLTVSSPESIPKETRENNAYLAR